MHEVWNREFRPRCPYPTTPILWEEELVAMSVAEEANMLRKAQNIHLQLDLVTLLPDLTQSLLDQCNIVSIYCSTHQIIPRSSRAALLTT